MSDKQDSTSSKRVPLTPRMYERLRDFSRGLDATYDETVDLLLGLVVNPDEDALLAGRRFRETVNKSRKSDGKE